MSENPSSQGIGGFFKSLFYFIGSRLFIFNMIKLVVVLALFVTALYWLLGCYTKHGDSVTVPSFKGMTIQQAEKLMDDRGLNYTVTDSVFDPAAKPLQVMEQEPVANTKVKPSRNIYLTLNAVKPPLVKLPNLIGKSFDIAQKNLELRGLRIGVTETRPDPASNTVLEVKYNGKILKEKDEVPKGAALTLVIADGIGDTELDIPELVGNTVEEAKFLIKTNNLNLGSIVGNGSISDTAHAFVYKQNPTAKKGEKIKMGEQVDIYISARMPEPTTVPPATAKPAR
jgi:eukaryotic-like serine/threonine-protein kinase